MPAHGQLAQLHTVGAPHPSPVLLYVHSCTITQRSKFRHDSRIMQPSVISCLLRTALAADGAICDGKLVLELLQIRHATYVLVDALQILALLYCALAALCYSSSMFYLKHPRSKANPL